MMQSWTRMSEVNKGNYTEKVKLFISMPRNKENREQLIDEATKLRLAINPEKDPEQWAAWERYFRARKVMKNFMRWIVRNPGSVMSVPAPWPDQFDEDYTASGNSTF